MSFPPRFTALSGEWKGTKRVYLSGASGPEKLSASRMTIAKAARGTFLLLDYTWKFEADSHEGVLLLGYDDSQRAATAAWGDSWHMNRKVMHCTGEIDGDGVFNVRGSYEVRPGPDLGWRIALKVIDANSITLVMHNIAHRGTEELAVQAEFARVG
ncbi:MAG: DUF1579 family protein [Betaproteobacteria bacterium]